MSDAELVGALAQDGYAFVDGTRMRAVFRCAGSLADWDAFAASWDDLGLDTYMADGGRYRKRRHAVYGAGPDGILRKVHQAHYQSRDYNALNGGIARWFEPVLPAIGAGPTMTTVLATCRALFERLTPAARWHIEVHQFRIEARAGQAGRPTPEGRHQDGVDH
ncbi:MAG: 2OG-Fe dioxygenase family protein, partial [Acetobacteraceae bacterium]